MSVAHHRIVDVIKSRKRRLQSFNSAPHELLDLHPTAGDSTEDAAHRNIARDEILEVLGQLPEEQRRVLVMAYFEGYSQSEIASRLGEPLGTVKTRARLGIQKLRAAMVPAMVQGKDGPA